MRKSQISEVYEKYLGPKCSRMTYYKRVKKGMNLREAIKPVQREEWHPKNRITTKTFTAEMEWYHQYQGPKINKQRFYQRMYRGYTKEEAIRIDFIPHQKKAPTPPKNIQIYPRKYLQKPKQDTDIRIKYQKEEADIIRREYIRMIDEMEYKWRICSDPIEAKEINDKIEKLKNEYKTFCLINY